MCICNNTQVIGHKHVDGRGLVYQVHPHYIFNHCMAPDEETGRIYVLGVQPRDGAYNEDWSELRYSEVRSLTI